MTEPQNSKPQNLPSPSSSNKNPTDVKPRNVNGSGNSNYSGQKAHYANPPDATNPDPATLREQWRFAIKQYSRWYAHAWGTAILAGLSFFALGWIIKGSNPLPSFKTEDSSSSSSSPCENGAEEDARQ